MRKRSNYPKEFKARVAFEALRGEKTIAQLSSEYEVHSNMILRWKKYLKENMADVFTRKNEKEPGDAELIDKLYNQIGKSQVEIDWLKKKLGL
jgi:transposase-like protein